MSSFRTIIKLLAFLFLSVNSFASIEDSIIPKEESEFAKLYLQRLIDNDSSFIKRHLSPEILPEVTDEKLNEIASYFPEGELLSTELIGSQVHTFNSSWQGNFSFEYEFEGGWAVANVVLKRNDEKSEAKVVGFNVHRTSASQKELNAFTLTDKSLLHYSVLVIAVIVPIFIVVSLVVCIRTPMHRRKWAWILFMVFGMGVISLNWSTGQWEIKPIHFQLLGTGALKFGESAPWVISTSIPLGAILFWFKRHKLLNAPAESEELSDVTQENYVECGKCNSAIDRNEMRGDTCPNCLEIV